jgi:hypothetical protein
MAFNQAATLSKLSIALTEKGLMKLWYHALIIKNSAIEVWVLTKLGTQTACK